MSAIRMMVMVLAMMIDGCEVSADDKGYKTEDGCFIVDGGDVGII